MDRFHRRLLWPIRTSAGEVIGFGARRLFDDDPMEAKYVNTPETMLYKKSSVMFGIDLAKRDIAKGHQAVVVEGYTDVMAMHLAGVTTAVASCGTAFGDEHLAMLRRLMMDDSFFRGELIYVFDGDAGRPRGRAQGLRRRPEAGRAVLRRGRSGRHGPLRSAAASGDAALRDLVATREPRCSSSRFAPRLPRWTWTTPRAGSPRLRRCVPMVGQIKDPTLRDEYARQLARLGRLGRRSRRSSTGCGARPRERQDARVAARRFPAPPRARAALCRRGPGRARRRPSRPA